MLLVVGDALGAPRRLSLHALLLGAVTNAIVIWSEHFVVTCAVMAAAAVHGVLQARGRPVAARAASMAALIGSVGVVLLGTRLVGGG